MKTRLFSALLLILWAGALMAQTDVVSGNAKTYAGDTLRMYSIDDYINKKETLIAQAPVDKDGNFSFSVRLKEVTQAYIDLTVFKCMLYLQPNTRQTIVLPEKQKIRPQDEMNPFFRKYEFYPKLIEPDPEDLNIVIPSFDRVYTQALNRILTSQYSVSKAQTDTLEAKIAAQFSCGNPFFKSYMKYRFGMLDNTAYHRNHNIIIEEFFSGKDVLYKNPAYNDLFDDVFSNVFTNIKEEFVNHQDKYMAIHDKSYHSLRQALIAEKKVGTDMLADYIILKGIKDAYYADTFPKENLVALVDSMALKSKTKDFRQIASNMSKDFTKLMCGYPAPEISISDRDGNSYSLNNFAGKFTYLIFFNPNSYTSQSDLSLLIETRKTIPESIMEIVVVFVSQERKSFTNFCDQMQEDYGFKFYWYGGNKEMLQKYDVRAFPMYYLISPEGNLSMNPAPGPTEFFQKKFETMYRNWKNDQYRREYKNKQGIR